MLSEVVSLPSWLRSSCPCPCACWTLWVWPTWLPSGSEIAEDGVMVPLGVTAEVTVHVISR